jgi:hypothetical protein
VRSPGLQCAEVTTADAVLSKTSAYLQFNLEIEEVQSAVRELEPWRRQITVPLVIEVRLCTHGQSPQVSIIR